jgi:hypothetical protein
MNRWMRKIAVALIAVLTFGLYTPTYLIADENNHNKEFISPEGSEQGNVAILPNEQEAPEETNPISTLTEKAKQQSLKKFGPKISEKVEDEFMEVILPNIELALKSIVKEDEAAYISITEQPTNGYGERIFNLHNERTNEDIAKFHVRRDNRPHDGFWFNFHYHLKEDNFEQHHMLGEIYYDKNTPPKWMA